MFDHSIKVPRLYKTASKVAKQVSEGRGSIKQLVYESKHPNIKALYALVVHTFQRTDHIEKLLKKSKLLIKEPRFDPWLAKILITELLWGKKHLSSQSKPVQTILAYEQIFKAHLSDVFHDDLTELAQVDKPRYVRVNTLKISVNEAVEGFREEGWFLKRYTETDNYLSFLEAVSNLGPEEFMIDLHIPYLLIFPPKTQFYQHPAYKKSSIILQDKASCLPVHILRPEPGSTILDMCAAPGMKTSQLAAIMENKGKIYAVEIHKKRFQTLTKIIESSEATCVETINADSLAITGKEYPEIEYILVDPSCSGSGITDRVETGQQQKDQHSYRLEQLAGFQIKMLRHALTRFPKVKRVVYSTCSIYPEENEDVVRQVLESCTTFKLVPAAPFLNGRWHNFGCMSFGDIGNYCLYAKPDIDLTSGFFVAVFERLQEGESNQFLNTGLFRNGKSNRKYKNNQERFGEEQLESQYNEFRKDESQEDRKHDTNIEDALDIKVEKKKENFDIKVEVKKENVDIKVEVKKENREKGGEETGMGDSTHKKKKKKKCYHQNNDEEVVTDALETYDVIKKNKKKKKQKKDAGVEEIKTEINTLDKTIVKIKKEKKKRKHYDTEEIGEIPYTEENMEIIEEHTTKSKKDKKNKMQKSGGEEMSSHLKEEGIVLTEEKKKKKKKQESAERKIEETIESDKTKKKRKKHTLD